MWKAHRPSIYNTLESRATLTRIRAELVAHLQTLGYVLGPSPVSLKYLTISGHLFVSPIPMMDGAEDQRHDVSVGATTKITQLSKEK